MHVARVKAEGELPSASSSTMFSRPIVHVAGESPVVEAKRFGELVGAPSFDPAVR